MEKRLCQQIATAFNSPFIFVTAVQWVPHANKWLKAIQKFKLSIILYYNIDNTLRALVGQKPRFCQSIKHIKRVFYYFSPNYLYIIKQMKKPTPCLHEHMTGIWEHEPGIWEHEGDVHFSRVYYPLCFVTAQYTA